MFGMRRREFITLLGGAAVAWPLAARAQQPERMRRIGILIAGAQRIQTCRSVLAAFRRRSKKLGWSEGRNVQIDIRFAAGKPDQEWALAKELTPCNRT